MADARDPPVAGPQAGAPVIKAFDGASSLDQERLFGLSFSPDCNGAASYNHFVEFINYVFTVYDKNNGTEIARISGEQFWEAAGLPSPGNIIDPRIVFIPDAGRNGQWLALQLVMGTRVMMATTNPNDIMADPSPGKWRGAAFDLPGNDFPMLGYDLNGIYIGVETAMPPPTPPPPPADKRSPQIVFIPRANALAYPPQLGPNVVVSDPLHREEFGDSLYPSIDESRAGWPYETMIGIDNVSRQHLTFSLFSTQFRQIISHGKIAVRPFEPIPFNYRVKQPDLSADGAVAWYNDGIVAAPMNDGFNIWLAQAVLRSDVQSLAVRWYRLAIDPMSRMPGLAASGEILLPNFDCFNPSILSFGRDDYTLVALSRSGNSATSRDPGSPNCGNLGAYVALVREGVPGQPPMYAVKSGQVPDYYPARGQRWGDFSTICRDPSRGARRAWIVNQYALQGGKSTSQWRNVFASIDLP